MARTVSEAITSRVKARPPTPPKKRPVVRGTPAPGPVAGPPAPPTPRPVVRGTPTPSPRPGGTGGRPVLKGRSTDNPAPDPSPRPERRVPRPPSKRGPVAGPPAPGSRTPAPARRTPSPAPSAPSTPVARPAPRAAAPSPAKPATPRVKGGKKTPAVKPKKGTLLARASAKPLGKVSGATFNAHLAAYKKNHPGVSDANARTIATYLTSKEVKVAKRKKKGPGGATVQIPGGPDRPPRPRRGSGNGGSNVDYS